MNKRKPLIKARGLFEEKIQLLENVWGNINLIIKSFSIGLIDFTSEA